MLLRFFEDNSLKPEKSFVNFGSSILKVLKKDDRVGESLGLIHMRRISLTSLVITR